MFGRSRKIQEGVLSQVHTAVADVAQDAIEQIIKERVRWLGVTVRFAHQGPCQNGEKYKATVRGYCKRSATRAYHGVHAIFDVRVYGNNTVEFDEGGGHEFSYEYTHEYWSHFHLRVENDGSVLIKPKHDSHQDPWTRADGSQVVLTESYDF